MTKSRVRIPVESRETGVHFKGQSTQRRQELELEGTDKRLTLDERRLQAQRRAQAIATLSKHTNPDVARVAMIDVRHFRRVREHK